MLKKKKKNKQIDESSDYPVCGIVKDIQELHAKYIKWFIDLHTHISVVDAEFYLMAQQALTRQYEAELTIAIEEAQELTNERYYLAHGKTEGMRIATYRRWFKHYNTPAKDILDERIANEVRGRLRELQEGVEPSEDETDGDSEEPGVTVEEAAVPCIEAPEEAGDAGDKEILPEDENSLDELYELGNEDENETDADGINTETESETGNGAEPQSEEDSEVQDEPEDQEGGEEDD